MMYYGEKKTYLCNESPLGGGAEGKIYASTDGKMAIKIFTHKAYLPEAERRIDHMLRHRPPVLSYSNGEPLFAWPVEKVYSDNYRYHFVGYAMPALGKEYRGMYTALRPRERAEFFGKDNSFLVTALSYNLVELVRSLEAAGYHLSDMNPSNLLLNKKGHLCMIDCDSLSFESNGISYGPEVSTFAYLPPELQDYSPGKSSKTFGEDSDRFMVAVMIWQLLFFNTHPFQKGHWNGKKAGTLIPDNISYGNAKWDQQSAGWPDISSMLPASTITMLKRVFGYTHAEITRNPGRCIALRPSLLEWHQELSSLLGLT